MLKLLLCTLLCMHVPQFLVASETTPVISPGQEKIIAEQAEQLLHQVAGIVATDTMNTQEESPVQQLTHGSYRSPSVDVLRAWLTGPLEDIFQYDPAIAACGEIIPQDFARVEQWCTDLTRHYQGARKRPLTQHALAARKTLSSTLSKNPTTHKALLERISRTDEPDKKRALCESIRKNIGSFCALRAARAWYTPMNQQSALVSIKELLQAGGDARELYNELGMEAYQHACDEQPLTYHSYYAPQPLQQLTESFLYDAYAVMKNLHTLEAHLVGHGSQPYDWFLVGAENFMGIYNEKGIIKTSALYGLFSSNALHTGINNNPNDAFGSIASIRGDTNACYVQSKPNENGSKHAFIKFTPPNHLDHTTFTTSTKHAAPYVSTSGAIASYFYDEPKKATSFAFHQPNSSQKLTLDLTGKWDIAVIDDSIEMLFAIGYYDTPPSSGYKELLIRDWHKTYSITIKKVLSPMLAVGHAKKRYAIGGYNKKGTLFFQVGSTLEGNTQSSSVPLNETPYRLKRLMFSRDDSHIVITLGTEEDKKSADQYYMINCHKLISDPDTIKPMRCTPPSLRTQVSKALMTAIDSYGEYIGYHAHGDNWKATKVTPTPYHIKTNLVPAMQKMSYENRRNLYLLHEGIQHAPGPMNISPEQWKTIFKKLDIHPHLFFRPQLRLTTTDGTKLQGLKGPSPLLYGMSSQGMVTIIKRSLAGQHAVYAASRIT